MALESATTIAGLSSSNPTAGDPVSQADDHLRLIKAVLKATPLVVDRAYGEYTTNADITAIIPFDDTIPQDTEGSLIMSLSITPKSTTNRLRVRFQGEAISSSGAVNVIAALFKAGSTNALRTSFVATSSSDFADQIVLEYEFVPASVAIQTFSVRVGTQTGATIRMNGSASSRLFGGTMAATLVIEEIQA